MDKADKLTELLKRLNAGEDPQAVKAEAQEFLASIDPKDLSLAEQKLIDAGLAPEDLRHLCSAHMEMLEEQVQKMTASLKPGHMIHTMVREHDAILCFLNELDDINKFIQKMTRYDIEREEFRRLKFITDSLVGAEPHHAREEKILFPEIQKRGVLGPPQVMTMEHEDLRRRKKEIKELSEDVGKMDFDAFKKRLDAAAKFIIVNLRDHIFKENNILYPTAIQVIREDKVWRNMKSKADEIGYCSFTPKV